MRWWAPPLLALQFLTRVPVPITARLTAAEAREGHIRAVGWFPLVGTLVGCVTAVVAVAAGSMWPAIVAVPIALIVEARMTGAFHEDAVADFCDAFGGGYTTDDVLRIMKDSRVGSYGALGLLLVVGLRAGLTVVLLGGEAWHATAVIVAAACFGRLTAVALMAIVRPVGSGLGKDVAGKVGQSTLLMAIATAVPGLAAFLLLEPLRLIAVVAVALLFLGWFRALLLRRIGGSTGDCLGFAAYAGQLILLLAATAGR